MTHCRIIGVMLLLLGASFAGQTSAQAPVLTEAGAQKAADNYQRYCALCHGKDREGHVNDHAPSLRSKSLLESEALTLREAIAYGRQGTPMGGYIDEVGGPMTRQDIGDMILWLRKTEAVEPVNTGRRSFERVVGDVPKGAAVYQQHCATCHGLKGEGGTGTAPSICAICHMEVTRVSSRIMRGLACNSRASTAALT